MKPLAVLVFAASIAGLPGTAAASIGSDTGRGERPQARLMTTHELQRLNYDALLDLQRARDWVEVDGAMGRYNSWLLIQAIRLRPGPTGRLIERIENARSDAERKEIINGLLRAAKRRLRASRTRLWNEKKILDADGLLDEYPTIISPPRIRENKRVQAYYALLRASYAEEKYIELLEGMQYVHSDR